jgi:SSS family solute:Na+ symporter
VTFGLLQRIENINGKHWEPLMKVTVWDVLVIAVYFVGVILFGLWLSRRQAKGGREFFLAGQQMKWPFIGASLFATNISSQQFVGQAGLAFTVGIIAGGFQMIGAMCFMFLAVFFINTYMGLKLTTSPEFFEHRYNTGCRTIVSFINVMMIVLANLAAALYAGANVLTHLLGWDAGPHANVLFWLAVFLMGIAAGTYTLLGGLKAVMFMNFVEMLVLVSAGALLLIFGMIEVGGIRELIAFTGADGRSMWTLAHPWNHSFGWLPMLTGTIVLGVHGHCTDQDYVQRALSAGNIYHAKMGALFGGFLKVLALFIIAAPGVIAGKLVSMGQLVVPEGDSAYVAMLTHVMPVGLLGVCLAGLLAAIMSSVDSGLCGCGSLLTYDFFGKLFKNADDKKMLVMGRIIMFVLILGCMFIAPFIRHWEGLFHYLLNVWALLAPPVFVCVVFGLFYSRANAKGAFTTLVVGCLLGFGAFAVLNFPILENVRSSLPQYLQNKLNVGFVNTVICTVVMFLVSHFSEHTEEDKRKAEYVRRSREVMPMSKEETVKYRIFAVAFIVVWIIVLLLFSPVGIGK